MPSKLNKIKSILPLIKDLSDHSWELIHLAAFLVREWGVDPTYIYFEYPLKAEGKKRPIRVDLVVFKDNKKIAIELDNTGHRFYSRKTARLIRLGEIFDEVYEARTINGAIRIISLKEMLNPIPSFVVNKNDVLEHYPYPKLSLIEEES